MPPNSRVLRNNERLLDAAVSAAAHEGWTGLTFVGVAERAGLSRRPLQDRYSDASHLMAAVWRERCGPALTSTLQRCLNASGIDGGGSPESLVAAMDALIHPDDTHRAAAELLMIAQFDSVVREEVLTTFGTQVASWCDSAGSGGTVRASQTAYLMSVGLGFLVFGRRSVAADLDFTDVFAALHEALRNPTSPSLLPGDDFTHLDRAVPFESGDATTDSLLQATLDAVGLEGYDRMSVDRIATNAGSSQGALFARYPSKLSLFIDATRRQNAIAMRLNASAIADVESAHGEGIAEATAIREFQQPFRAYLRAITLEGIRVAWHDEDLRQAVLDELAEWEAEVAAGGPASFGTAAWFQFGFAVGVGVLVLPLVFESCWKLSYDVVTVPLVALQAAQLGM
jgi:AcrR family transcriptional regulator